MNIDLKELTEEFSLPMEAVQERLETELSVQGYVRKVYETREAYQRALDGSTDVSGLPRGRNLLLRTIELCEVFLKNMVQAELPKKIKSRFYNDLILGPTAKYLEDDRRMKEQPWSEKRYENPMALLPYFMARELGRILVLGSISATELARRVADAYHRAYNGYYEASESELISCLQLLRSFMISEENRYFEEGKEGSTVMFSMNEQYEGMVLTENEVVETLEGFYAKFKPMLVQPLPHTSLLDESGGYLGLASPILKRSEDHIIRQVGYNSPAFFDAFNRLQSTAWQINIPLFEWMQECGHPEVNKHFSTNSARIQQEVAKAKRSSNRRIVRIKKRISAINRRFEEGARGKELLQLTREKMNLIDEIDVMQVKVDELKTKEGQIKGWEETIKDIAFYRNFPVFYHPLFCDKRGRIYTYNTSLSFQGNSLSKSVIQTANKKRLTPEGLETLYELLGGMAEGLGKAKGATRLEWTTERLQDIFNVVEHKSYKLLDELDEDEVMASLPLIHAIYEYHHNPKAVTGVLAYIDSTSSAIQIQGLVQKCERAAWLTNLISNPEEEQMPDAYMEVSNTSKKLVKGIASQTNEDLKNVLALYIQEYMPEDASYLDNLDETE